jgi:hypothetical protein
MQIKESHATLMLLSIIFISSMFKPVNIKLSENVFSIIGERQVPIYPTKPSNNTEFEASIDTTMKQTNSIRKDASRNWMSRYKGGIKFEFYPPN